VVCDRAPRQRGFGPMSPAYLLTFPTNRGVCFASVGATSDNVFRVTFILQHYIATTEGDQRRSPLINSNEWEHPAWKNWRLL